MERETGEGRAPPWVRQAGPGGDDRVIDPARLHEVSDALAGDPTIRGTPYRGGIENREQPQARIRDGPRLRDWFAFGGVVGVAVPSDDRIATCAGCAAPFDWQSRAPQ